MRDGGACPVLGCVCERGFLGGVAPLHTRAGVGFCPQPHPGPAGALRVWPLFLLQKYGCGSPWRPRHPATAARVPLCTRGPAGQARHPSGAGFQWQLQSARFLWSFSAAWQSLGAWQREARSREEGVQSKEMELGAVNRFAFYGVREFISGHSPDGCNKLVKCDPPPGAGALARLLRGKGGWYSRAFPRHSSPSLACLCSTGEEQVTGTNLCLFPDGW